MKDQIQELTQKQMTRREFLTTLGMGLLAMVGISSVINIMLGKRSGPDNKKGSDAYGGSPYGG